MSKVKEVFRSLIKRLIPKALPPNPPKTDNKELTPPKIKANNHCDQNISYLKTK